MLRSKLDYGASVYSTTSPSLLNPLEPVHNACLRTILRMFSSSPVTNLQALTGIPPLSTLTSSYALLQQWPIPERFIENYNQLFQNTISTQFRNVALHPNISNLPYVLIKFLPLPQPLRHRIPNRIIWNMQRSSAVHPKDLFYLLLQDFHRVMLFYRQLQVNDQGRSLLLNWHWHFNSTLFLQCLHSQNDVHIPVPELQAIYSLC